MITRLDAVAREYIEDADRNDFLICPRNRSEMTVWAWAKKCREKNRHCVYALLSGDYCDVILMTSTKSWITYTDGPEELQKVFDRYADRSSESQIDEDGCRFSFMPIYYVVNLCKDILGVANCNWYEPD